MIFFRLCLILARSTSRSVQSYALWLESARLGAYFRERKRSSHLRDEMIEPSVNGRTGSEKQRDVAGDATPRGLADLWAARLLEEIPHPHER